MSKVKIYFFGSLMCVMIITMGLLISEYWFFKQQALLMVEVKQDYQNHLVAVKKVLTEYNCLKELFEQRDGQDDEKKKMNGNGSDNLFVVKEGAKIFSTDAEISDSFFVINREWEYLKQSSMDYLAHYNLDREIGPEEWLEYHDYIKENRVLAPAVQPKGKKKKNTRNCIVSGSQVAKKSAEPTACITKDIHCSWPIKRSDFWISSKFGPRKKNNGADGFHHGIDMAAVKGTPVMAAADGVVVEAGYNVSGYGHRVVIAHNRKYRTCYAHLDKICTRVGRTVSRGELIGRVGETGHVRKKGKDASHLHFELQAFGKKVNPLYFLS